MNADMLRDYIRAGLVLVPIRAGSKRPSGKAWNQRAHCWATPDAVPDIYSGNVGLAHVYAGTCALDIDHAELAAPALERCSVNLAALLAAPDAVHIRSGRPGRDKLLYRLREPLTSINRSAAEGFELRCAADNGLTVQDLLPPSIHPDTGKPYQWRGDWRTLPDIPDALLTAWRVMLRGASGRAHTASDATVTPLPTAQRHRRTLPAIISEGERNATLLSLAAGLVRKGHDLLAVTRRLQRTNAERCEPPLCATEVDTIAMRAIGYGSDGFRILPDRLLDSLEWRALPPPPHDVILAAYRRFDGFNNGNIALPWSDFKDRDGFRNEAAFYRHRAAAVQSGILVESRKATHTQHGITPTLYAIAERFLQVSLTADCGSSATATIRMPYIDKQVVGSKGEFLAGDANLQRGTNR